MRLPILIGIILSVNQFSFGQDSAKFELCIMFGAGGMCGVYAAQNELPFGMDIFENAHGLGGYVAYGAELRFKKKIGLFFHLQGSQEGLRKNMVKNDLANRFIANEIIIDALSGTGRLAWRSGFAYWNYGKHLIYRSHLFAGYQSGPEFKNSYIIREPETNHFQKVEIDRQAKEGYLFGRGNWCFGGGVDFFLKRNEYIALKTSFSVGNYKSHYTITNSGHSIETTEINVENRRGKLFFNLGLLFHLPIEAR